MTPDFERLKSWVSQDWKAQAEWRDDARDDFGFVAGGQWTEEEQNYLKEQNRVPIVFNRVATIINSVAGAEINNRTEVRYLPRTIGDAEPNEIYSRAAEWFRDQSDAEEEDSGAFHDALVCGLGWTETRLDFEGDPEGMPVVDRISPLEMCWDSHASKRALVDMRRVARVRRIAVAEAKEMFPGKDASEIDASWLDKGSEPSEEATYSGDDYAEDGDDVEKPGDTVTVVQMQWRDRREFVEYAINGQRGEMKASDFAKIEKVSKRMGVPISSRKFSRWEYQQAFLGRDEVLRRGTPCREHFTFCPITGYWDAKERVWFGLLRSMRDPQKFANKWLSQSLHIINANAKGGIVVEEGATDDPREFENTWSAADSVQWVKPGAISGGKIKEKPQAQYPAALMQLTEFALVSIRDASGVNQELLGLQDRNQPGILEYQRKQSAMTTLAVLFDALRYYRKRQGEVLLYYITEYLAGDTPETSRLVRIVGDEGARYVPLLKDPDTRKYDVIVDDAPASPNNKERVWQTIRDMLPTLAGLELGPDIWAEIIDYSPFPATLIEKLKQKMQQAGENPEQKKAMEVEFMQRLADLDKTKSETEENKADTVLTMMKARTAPIEARAGVIQKMLPR